MKWRVDIEYEDGSFTEPRRIAFQAIYDGEPYYGYDTKKEALEAFCMGQVAMESMRKEREAEQKKEEQGVAKAENAIINDFSPLGHSTRNLYEAMGMKPKEEQTITYPNKMRLNLEVEKEVEDKLFGRFEERLNIRFVALEERLTEIEGVLSSMGSPEWDLRKKVDGLEKGLAQLTDTFYICANNETHNYDDLRKKVEEIEKDLYKISHLFGKDDSTDELKISKLDVASQKIDLLLTFLEAVCRNLGNDIKKIK